MSGPLQCFGFKIKTCWRKALRTLRWATPTLRWVEEPQQAALEILVVSMLLPRLQVLIFCAARSQIIKNHQEIECFQPCF